MPATPVTKLIWAPLFCLLCLLSNPAHAGEEHTYPMAAKTLIKIDSFDATSQTYEVVMVQLWGQGPLIATPEEVAGAIEALNIDNLNRSPSSIVGNQYMTDNKMMLLPPSFVEARKQKIKIKPVEK